MKTFILKTTLSPATLPRPVRLCRASDPLINCFLGLHGEFRVHRCEKCAELLKPLVGTIRFFEADENLGTVRRSCPGSVGSILPSRIRALINLPTTRPASFQPHLTFSYGMRSIVLLVTLKECVHARISSQRMAADIVLPATDARALCKLPHLMIRRRAVFLGATQASKGRHQTQ